MSSITSTDHLSDLDVVSVLVESIIHQVTNTTPTTIKNIYRNWLSMQVDPDIQSFESTLRAQKAQKANQGMSHK